MNTWPFELVAMPMPSPRYRSGGSLKKFGTDVWGMIGTFSAFALVWAKAGPPPRSATIATQDARHCLIETSGKTCVTRSKQPIPAGPNVQRGVALRRQPLHCLPLMRTTLFHIRDKALPRSVFPSLVVYMNLLGTTLAFENQIVCVVSVAGKG